MASVNKFVFNNYNIINVVCLDLSSYCLLSVSFRLLFLFIYFAYVRVLSL